MILPARKQQQKGQIRPAVEIRLIKEVLYDGRIYKLITSEKLIHSLSDLYEIKNIIYIDKGVPERFYEGLIIYEIELRKILKQGLGYLNARVEAHKKELAYYQAIHGIEEGLKIIQEEYLLKKQMFTKEIEMLPQENGHKIIYEKHEILPA